MPLSDCILSLLCEAAANGDDSRLDQLLQRVRVV